MVVGGVAEVEDAPAVVIWDCEYMQRVSETAKVVELRGLRKDDTVVHHQLLETRQGICTLGGGIQSFAFGPVFAASLWMPWREGARLQPASAMDVVPSNSAGSAVRGGSEGGDLSQVGCLLVPKRSSKRVKTALERGGIFDRSWRIAPVATSPDLLAIPVSHEAWKQIVFLVTDAPEGVDASLGSHEPLSEGVQKFLQELEGELKEVVVKASLESLPKSAAALASREYRLSEALNGLIERRGLPKHVLKAAIAKHLYEVVGDVLLLDEQVFGPEWDGCLEELWKTLIEVFGVTRLAGKATVQTGTKRESQVILCRM